MAAADSSGIRRLIDGTEFKRFTAVNISMSVNQVADAFAVDAVFDPEDSSQKTALKPFQYLPFQLFLGDDKLMTGSVESNGFKWSAAGCTATIQGRSKTGILVDCPVLDSHEFLKMSVADIARKVCQPYKVSVRADADSEKIEKSSCAYGKSVADFLAELCTARGLLLGSSFDGQLVISRASSIPSATPAARLEEGDGILLEASATFDATRRFSEYTAATQYGGSECVSGTAQDSGIKIKRPCITVTSDMAQDASQTAKKLCADGIAASTSVSATVSGWRRPDNKRWAERQVVTLKSPSLYLSTEKSWVINSVNYKLSAQDGMTTALTLVPPASFTGSTSGGEIWS